MIPIFYASNSPCDMEFEYRYPFHLPLGVGVIFIRWPDQGRSYAISKGIWYVHQEWMLLNSAWHIVCSTRCHYTVCRWWDLWHATHTYMRTVSPRDFIMMTSSNGNIFRVTGPLCGEFTGHRLIPLTKASDAELWCFLWSSPWINRWVNNPKAGDLKLHRAHYGVTVV